jgi:hypothetical protein
LDAFSRGLKTAPVLVNNEAAWGGIAVCDWDLPWITGFDLEENNDFIVAYHSAGSRTVRAACNGPWCDTVSVPGLISVIPPGRHVAYRIEGQVSFCSIHVPHSLLEGLLTSAFQGTPHFRFALLSIRFRRHISAVNGMLTFAPARPNQKASKAPESNLMQCSISSIPDSMNNCRSMTLRNTFKSAVPTSCDASVP